MEGRGAHPTISVVIPVYEGASLLESSLAALRTGGAQPEEILVVDDGSSDDPASVALRHGATLLRSDIRRGPAHARNLGARAARGDIVLFLDADVLASSHTIERVAQAFLSRPDLDAVIGSYDDAPASPGFASQYKNLMHCFVHQSANRNASTFWSGCGAIRREVFLRLGGFDEAYDRPAIEDIELGYRLVAQHHRIELDPQLTVKHLKHWTLVEMIHCDVFDRGVPWTELIWRDRVMPNDLNLRTSQRWSVLLVGTLLLLSIASLGWLDRGPVALSVVGAWLLAAAAIVRFNRDFFDFLLDRRGIGFAVAAAPMQVAFYGYSGFAFLLGTARYAAGFVQQRSELPPLEPSEVPAAESA